MGNAVWLFFAVPEWYFSTIVTPSGDLLNAIPALGVASLVVGAIWGVIKRRPGLLIFLVLPAASQILVVVAGALRGSLESGATEPIVSAFVALQVAVAVFFIFWIRGARLPAAALAIFTSSYAFFAGFVATMAFSDRWL